MATSITITINGESIIGYTSSSTYSVTSTGLTIDEDIVYTFLGPGYFGGLSTSSGATYADSNLEIGDSGTLSDLTSESTLTLYSVSERVVSLNNLRTFKTKMEAYIAEYGGKIDSISIDGVTQTIDSNKNVDLPAYPTKSSLGLSNVDNTSDVNKPISAAQQVALNQKLDKIPVTSNGLLIDSSTDKINTAYIPDYILGQVIYGGLFNANTKVATLSTGAQSKLGTSESTLTLGVNDYATYEGLYFVVNVAGTFASISFAIGDWLIATASGWGKVDNTDEVTSVNEKTGSVTLTASDVGAVAANTAITGATKCKITYDSKGLVTGGEDLSASDIPVLDASKITSGNFSPSRLPNASSVSTGIIASNYALGYNSAGTIVKGTAPVLFATDAQIIALFGD